MGRRVDDRGRTIEGRRSAMNRDRPVGRAAPSRVPAVIGDAGLVRESLRVAAAMASAAAAFGLVEASLLLARDEVAIGGARLLPAAAILYGVLGAAAGVGLVALRRVAARVSAAARRPGWHLAAAAALAAVVAIAWPINRAWLGDALSPASVATNGALLLIGAPLLARGLAPVVERLARTIDGSRWLRARVALVAVSVTAAVPWLMTPAGGGSSGEAAAPAEAGDEARPNVLLLILDTLRADRLGCQGGDPANSPNLDALASRGVRFSQCLAAAPYTKPSVASLLTGRLPPRLGMEPFGARLPTRERPLATVLREVGYRTGLFSANAFVSPTFGFGRGVERYVGPQVSPAAALVGFHVLARLRDAWVEAARLPESPWRWYEALVSLPFDRSLARHDPRAPELVSELLRFVDECEASGSREVRAPWFAHVQLMETHAPYRPAASQLRGPPVRSEVALPDGAAHLFLPFRTAAPLPAAELAAMNATYDACVRTVDAAVGGIVAALEARGLLESTLVIVTSDHGEEFFDHGGFGHGHSLHRELLHVPLIWCAPGRLPAGRVVASQVRLIDLVPTLLELLSLAPPPDAPDMDGQSLLSALRRRPDDGEAEVEDRVALATVEWGGSSAAALRDGARTVIVARDGSAERVQCFDATGDPAEQHDLAAGDAREAAAAATSAAELWTLVEHFAADRATESAAILDPATQALLESLGYANR
jgi:arylsulfatase A-like enzyme